MKRITPWVAVVLGVCLAAACKGKAKEAAGGATAAAEPGVAAAPTDAGVRGGAAAAAAASGAADEKVIAADARAFLERWLGAQNGRDFAAYAAMYDAKHFRGVKRTHGGKVKNYDGPGWTKDRKKMFDTGFTVAAEEVEVETWLAPKSKLKPAVVSLRFLQRWKGGGYADHGTKVLQLWRDAGGAWHIVYEDLLNSEKGWDRTVDDVADLAFAAPKDEAAALALWKQVKPTGADYEDRLSAIPDNSAVRRPMAVALLKEGNFACTEIVDTGNCGEEILELAPLDDKAGLGDACLRRRLALWALAQLDPADVPPLGDDLVELVKLARPEEELPAAAFGVVPPTEDGLRLTMMNAAIDGERKELADGEVGNLAREASVLEAAGLSLDAAVKRLDGKKHRAALLAALVDSALTVETRSGVLDGLADDQGKDLREALVELTKTEDCGLAMRAAELLEARGDKRFLPHRPDSGDASAYMRALCLLAHDSDATRQEARWQEFLADKVVLREVSVDDFGYEGDDEEGEGEGEASDESDAADPNAESGEIIERMSGSGLKTERWTTEPRASILFDTAKFGLPGTECTGNTCSLGESWSNTSASFEPAADGTLRLDELQTYQWSGCGC